MKSPGAMKPKNVRARLVAHTEKGSRLEFLPSWHALNKISGGDPLRRTIGDYAKAGPSIVDEDMDGK